MKRREIAREEWQEFFDSFNGQHEGWLVGVDRFDEFLDESVETRHLDGALRGVQSEDGAIALAVDDRSSGHSKPRRFRIRSASCSSSRRTKSIPRSKSTARSRASSCGSASPMVTSSRWSRDESMASRQDVTEGRWLNVRCAATTTTNRSK